MNIQTLKGFRDFLPQEARKRQYVIDTLKSVFELYGFEPLETPILEYEEILAGKYGEEGEKLMYRFEDNGKRKVAMRYDQTVPLARLVTQYQNELAFPFKRYQIANVWRAENTQKGRYREFLQCDIDTVGIDSGVADADVVATAADALKALGLQNFTILLNDRSTFEGLPTEAIIVIDKLKKIGEEGVCEELVERQICKNNEEAYSLLRSIMEKKPTERIEQILKELEQLGISQENIQFSPTLARGLDYYTGLIFEIESPDYPFGSLCGGGRYNNLIGMFAGKQIPAVGFALGFDRTMEAMEALNLFPKNILQSTTKVFVTLFDEVSREKAYEVIKLLRQAEIPSEIWLGESTKLDKQLKYADAKGIPYAVIIGPEEVEKNVVTLKNLQTREQQQLPLEEIIKKLLQ